MFLLLCFAVAFAQTGADCSNRQPACPAVATLVACTPGEKVFSDDRCCELCRLPTCIRCNAGSTTPLRACGPNERPSTCPTEICTNSQCCPICTPPPCNFNCPTDIPVCTTNVPPPSTCQECPQCKPAGPVCTGATLGQCRPASDLGECTAENPLVPGCCPNCRPRPPCSENQRTACIASLASLPECPTDADFARSFDPATCCHRCKPRAPPNPCTDANSAAAVREIPDCDANERPVWFPGQCTGSCRERGSQCPPLTVENSDLLPECPVNVEPAFVACKPTCRKPRPVCTPVCGADQKCRRRPTGEGECVNTDRCRTFIVGGIRTDVQPGDIFDRIVQIHCENQANAQRDRCALFERILRDSLVCTREAQKRGPNGETFDVVKCCFNAGNPAAVGRRLLTSDDLIGGASNNPGATEGLTFMEEESSAHAAGLSMFAVVLALLY